MVPSCWFADFEIGYFREQFASFELVEWPVVKDGLRLPRDFDESAYLELNPDLASIGMNLRKHFLLYGSKERRRYRKFDLRSYAGRLMLRVRHWVFRHRLPIREHPV